MHTEKADFTVSCLILALGLKIQLYIALLMGAVIMILTRVMTIDETYKSVDWMTVFLLAGLIPLAINMAVQSSAIPRMAALIVAVTASNTFILPTHQVVNALIMRLGGYKVIDYVRADTGMTFLYIAVVMSIMYFFYGISA